MALLMFISICVIVFGFLSTMKKEEKKRISDFEEWKKQNKND